MTLPETLELSVGEGRVLRYCLYGPAEGFPVIFHGGSPSSRWKWPGLMEAMEQSKLRLLVYDRPGYGGSSRRPGRIVADVVDDVRALADTHGWPRFAIFGGSGGGPHALACAALLADRVTRCAVLSGIKPGEVGSKPRREEPDLRSRLAQVAAEIMDKIEAGGPEIPTEPGPPARTDPDAMTRIPTFPLNTPTGCSRTFLRRDLTCTPRDIYLTRTCIARSTNGCTPARDLYRVARLACSFCAIRATGSSEAHRDRPAEELRHPPQWPTSVSSGWRLQYPDL